MRVAVCLLACFTSLAALAQDLSAMLSQFEIESDLEKKELILTRLTQTYPNSGFQLLKIARKTHDLDTKWLAIRGIGWLKFKEASPFLKKCLYSESDYVRANSARSLGEVHDTSSIAELINLLRRDRDDGVIEQTALSLQMLHATEAVPHLKTKIEVVSSVQTRIWILGAVLTLGSKRDIPFFAGFLSDKDVLLASVAAQSIERFTGQDFGFPKCSSGPCPLGKEPIINAQRWWNDHKQEWSD